MPEKALLIQQDVSVQEYLQEEGYWVFIAENNGNARNLLVRKKPSLVICTIPPVDPDFISSVISLRNKPDEKYIFILAVVEVFENADLSKQLAEAGVDDFLFKPFMPAEIPPRVRLAERVASLENRLRSSGQPDDAFLPNDFLIRLLPGIIHEINNPLCFVGSNLSTMTQYAETVFEQIHRCDELAARLEAAGDPALSKDALKRFRNFSADSNISFIKTDMTVLLEECRTGIQRIQKLMHDLDEIVWPHDSAEKSAKTGTNPNDILETAINVVWNELKYKATVKKSYGQLPILPGFPRKTVYAFLLVFWEISRAVKEPARIAVHTTGEKEAVQIRISVAGCNMQEGTPDIERHPCLRTAAQILHRYNGRLAVLQEAENDLCFLITFAVNAAREDAVICFEEEHHGQEQQTFNR